MRFVRVYLDATGNPAHVMECETPLDGMSLLINGVAPQHYDLGLVDDFDPIALDGSACCHAAHIFERIEKHPLADTDPDAPKVRFKPQHTDVPRVHFCPVETKLIEEHIKANGVARISMTARAWLTCILPDEEVRRLGVGGGIPLGTILTLENSRRLLIDGGRRLVMEREIQRRADAAQAKRTETNPL